MERIREHNEGNPPYNCYRERIDSGEECPGVCLQLLAWWSPSRYIHLLSSSLLHILPREGLSGGEIQRQVSGTRAVDFPTLWGCGWPQCLSRAPTAWEEVRLSSGSSSTPDKYVCPVYWCKELGWLSYSQYSHGVTNCRLNSALS